MIVMQGTGLWVITDKEIKKYTFFCKLQRKCHIFLTASNTA